MTTQVLQNQMQEQFIEAKKFSNELDQHLSEHDTTMETNSDHSVENYVPQYDKAKVQELLMTSAQTVNSIGATIEKVNLVQERIRDVQAGCQEVFAKAQKMEELVEKV